MTLGITYCMAAFLFPACPRFHYMATGTSLLSLMAVILCSPRCCYKNHHAFAQDEHVGCLVQEGQEPVCFAHATNIFPRKAQPPSCPSVSQGLTKGSNILRFSFVELRHGFEVQQRSIFSTSCTHATQRQKAHFGQYIMHRMHGHDDT